MKSKLIQYTFTALILFIPVLIATPSQAQDKKSKITLSERDLVKFIGLWESNAIITVDSVPHTVLYRMNFRKTADGHGIYMDEGFTDSTLGNLRGANVIGYNANDSTIHWFSVDNMGNAHDHVGGWKDSDTLLVEHNSMRAGKKYHEKINFSFYGPDIMYVKLIATVDGKVTEKIIGTFYRKQLGAPAKKQ